MQTGKFKLAENKQDKIKVAVIFGTRPEAIKLFPVINELKARNFDPIVISTGQQRDLLLMTLESLKLVPDISLELMHPNPTNTSFMETCISHLNNRIKNEKIAFVIVQGDTFSAAAGAITGYLNQIPVGHVEAGLRSNNLYSPWPEEGLRRIIDGISNLLWAPTSRDLVPVHSDQKIHVVGNTVADALRLIVDRNKTTQNGSGPIVVTLHRRESFGDTMISALNNLVVLSENMDREVIFLQHPNPMVADAIAKSDLSKSNIKVISPLPYVEFMQLISRSSLLITDSGGLQEESSILNIPTIVLRDTTERLDALEENRSFLSPPDGSRLEADSKRLLENFKYESSGKSSAFGEGFSSTKIVDDLESWLAGELSEHS